MTHLSRFVPRALALSALLLSPAAFSQESPAFIAPATWNTPFNGIAQVACHNCYEKQYASTFSSVLDSVRTLELDFWDQRDAVTGGSPRHWFVRHNPGTLFQSGNDNNCTGDGTGKNDLEACLNDVKNWSENHPGHFPITVILDKKQGWSKESSGRTPKDFDELVTRVFQGKLYTPRTWPRTSAAARAPCRATSRASPGPPPASFRARSCWCSTTRKTRSSRSTPRPGLPAPRCSSRR
ncbi:Ca2+-dependent phosphoinositide-specific phospholipase C [Pseudomonas protegens]|uniref:Ca2+-dependent phosphoinositide-specific phospholipase C n=1 Tax=Pseudomonas protegens TaxID=380021 RepID=UPI00177FF4D1|nr:Ca2+-dependent phosphoinositide-specific phospholipase C [Pseudomonas protegens]